MRNALALALLALLALTAAFAATAVGSTDPVGRFDFVVEVEGLDACPVAFVDGLETRTDVIDYRSGADRSVRRIPGRHHAGPIVLRRGVTSDTSWWDWRKAVVDGAPDRRAVRIRVLDATRADDVLAIAVAGAWPAAYRISPLDANVSGLLYEELELVPESIAREDP